MRQLVITFALILLAGCATLAPPPSSRLPWETVQELAADLGQAPASVERSADCAGLTRLVAVKDGQAWMVLLSEDLTRFVALAWTVASSVPTQVILGHVRQEVFLVEVALPSIDEGALDTWICQGTDT